MLQVNPILDKVQISLIRQIALESMKYQNVPANELKLINLTIGEPDLPQPKELLEKSADFIKTANLGYPKSGGVTELRELIAKKYSEEFNLPLTEENVLITVGSTEGLSAAIRTIVQPGDEIILPLPAYPGYEPALVLAGAKVVYIDTTDKDYQLTVEDLKSVVTEKTRGILLNYPTNPTGAMISAKNRDEILDYIHEKELYLISDEVYSQIVFEGKHNSFLDMKNQECFGNVIYINGFSKSHSLTGWRIGYIVATKELIKSFVKVHQYTVTSPSVISQQAGIYALRDFFDVSSNTAIYKERVDSVYKELAKFGIGGVKPKGAIYAFIDLRPFGVTDSYSFCMELLKEKRVSTVPGIAFGVEGFLRMSLVKDTPILLEGINRIAEFLKLK